MYYVVPSCTLRNLKSIGIGANCFCDLVRSKPFVCQGLLVPSLNLKVSSIDQNPIVNVELSSFFNIKGASFVANTLEDIVDMLVHCSHSVQSFLCGRRGEFIIVVVVYGTWIKAIETSVGQEFVSSVGSGVAGKFCQRQLYLPTVLPIVAVDMKVLLECLDCSFAKSICCRW